MPVNLELNGHKESLERMRSCFANFLEAHSSFKVVYFEEYT